MTPGFPGVVSFVGWLDWDRTSDPYRVKVVLYH